MSAAQQRDQAMALVRAALAAVEPGAAVRRALRVTEPGDEPVALEAGGQRYSPGAGGRVLVTGCGKASVAMTHAVVELLGPAVSGGLVITKHGATQEASVGPVEVACAAHPVPDAAGDKAARRLVQKLDGLTAEDLVICLISGGGSALMTLPVEGVSLEELQEVNDLLLGAGAPIEAINAVRKHLSRVKGGQLAALAAPARVLTLILSDVVGSPLDVIASGPTAPDPTTHADALEVLRRYRLLDRVPAAALDHLRKGEAGETLETPGPDDPLFSGRVNNVLVGANEQAALAAVDAAAALGFNSMLLTTYLQGEAREAGRALAAILRELCLHGRPLARPACVVLGGETTVTLGEGHGKGGRNQELALAAALDLAGLEDCMLVALATDGGDGPTDAGGALCDGGTVARARALGLDPVRHLERNDAYPLFKALGDLLMLGQTGTNVNDITLLLAF